MYVFVYLFVLLRINTLLLNPAKNWFCIFFMYLVSSKSEIKLTKEVDTYLFVLLEQENKTSPDEGLRTRILTLG